MVVTRCQICGMGYVAELADDRAQHRKHHAAIMRVLQPSPTKRFLRLIGSVGNPAHVDWRSPVWQQNEMYQRARMFRREFDYDIVQWDSGDQEAHGYLFNDDTGAFGHGAIVGACAFRHRQFSKAPAGWTMDWIWLIPRVRRKGILSRVWPIFKARFGEFYLYPPLSDAMAAFASKVGYDHAKSMAANSN